MKTDFKVTTHIIRTLKSISSRAGTLLKSGIIKEELCQHPFVIDTFLKTETVAGEEYDNFEKFVHFVKSNKILDYELLPESVHYGEHIDLMDELNPYVKCYNVTILNYQKLEKLISELNLDIKSDIIRDYSHLHNRVIKTDGDNFFAYGKIFYRKTNGPTFSRDVLSTLLFLAKEVEESIDFDSIWNNLPAHVKKQRSQSKRDKSIYDSLKRCKEKLKAAIIKQSDPNDFYTGSPVLNIEFTKDLKKVEFKNPEMK